MGKERQVVSTKKVRQSAKVHNVHKKLTLKNKTEGQSPLTKPCTRSKGKRPIETVKKTSEEPKRKATKITDAAINNNEQINLVSAISGLDQINSDLVTEKSSTLRFVNNNATMALASFAYPDNLVVGSSKILIENIKQSRKKY